MIFLRTSRFHSLHGPRWWLVPIAIALFCCALPLAYAAGNPTNQLTRPEGQAPQQAYNAAKAYAQRLDHDGTLGKNRENWVQAVHSFRKIFNAERKGPLGPSSLYITARTYQRMFERFRQPQDIENAQSAFLELADVYPGNTLADDALFAAAQCAQLQPGKEQLATDLYKKITLLYPTGDQNAAAQKLLGGTGDRKAEPATKQGSTPSAVSSLTQLFPAKYWSSPDYCRIVLQASSPLAFSPGTVTRITDKSKQLTFDLAQSSRAPHTPYSLSGSQGLFKQITSRRLNEDTVRVNIDVESLSDFSIFTLTDPFRIVVDIRGEKTASEKKDYVDVVAEKAAGSPQATLSLAQPQHMADSYSADVMIAVKSLTDQKKRAPSIDVQPVPQGKSSEKLSLAQQLGLGVRKIVIDPGHGGKDPGAMAFGLKEKDIVLKISKKVAALLKEKSRYEVVLTRNRDVFLPLEERTAMANANKSDLFISIHINAHADHSKSGIETYFLNLATDASAMRVAAFENATSTHNIGELQDILNTLMKKSKIEESTRLARFVHTNLVTGSDQWYRPRDLGVKQAPFFVLLGAQMPAVLAEISFITNPQEAKLLQSEAYLDKIAAQLAAGIVAYVDHHHTAALKY